MQGAASPRAAFGVLKERLGIWEEHLEHCMDVYKMVVLGASLCRSTLKEHLQFFLGQTGPALFVVGHLSSWPWSCSSWWVTSTHRTALPENLDRGEGSIQIFVRKWVTASSPPNTFSIVPPDCKEFSICLRGEKTKMLLTWSCCNGF